MLVRYMVLERKMKLCSAIVDNFLRKKNVYGGYRQWKKISRTIEKSKDHVLMQTFQGHIV